MAWKGLKEKMNVRKREEREREQKRKKKRSRERERESDISAYIPEVEHSGEHYPPTMIYRNVQLVPLSILHHLQC